MSIYIDNFGDMSALDEECPLCMEPLEIDDLNFFPCTCGYQICRFCWHRIRTDENGLCPACRKAYSENPADFKPLTHEELQKIKKERKQKDASRRQKVTESRKHLQSVRVVQKNLVFVVGLGPRLADPEVLKKSEYFGKFGRIHKVVVNHTTAYAGAQGPSASAYITYVKDDDSLRAIQAVNNLFVDGRTLKASLGTTKYCSSFLNSATCPKPVTCPRADCMYLHELGEEEASFTKEEMQLGKHTEFEQRLHETLNRSEMNNPSSTPPTTNGGGISSGFPSAPVPAPPTNEPPIPLMASNSASSSSSGNSSSSSTIVSLMGLDLSKTISARKKTASQSPPPPPPPPPPPSCTLVMDSRGVIKSTNRVADTPPVVEWPALGGSKGGGGGVVSEISRSIEIPQPESQGATPTEVASFSTVVNGNDGGAVAERRRDRDGDAEVGPVAMETGAGDGEDKENAKKGRKKSGKKDSPSGALGEETGADSKKAAGGGNHNNNNNNNKKQQQQQQQSREAEKSARSVAGKGHLVKGEKSAKKKVKEDPVAAKKGAGVGGGATKGVTPKDKSAEPSSRDKSEASSSKKAKQQTSPQKESCGSEEPPVANARLLPPSPSPSPPFSSSPSSSRNSSLSSTPSSGHCLSTASKESSSCRSASSTTVPLPTARPAQSTPPLPRSSQSLSTPDASPDDSRGGSFAEGSLHSNEGLSVSSLPPDHFPDLTVNPVNDDDNPNSSFFSHYIRVRLRPDESSAPVPPHVEEADESEAKENDWSAAFKFPKENKEGSRKSLEDEDEDLGFDPFCESQRGLADLIRESGQEIDRHSSHFPSPNILPPYKSNYPRPNHVVNSSSNPPSLLDGLIQQHQLGESASADVSKNSSASPSHPPGFFSSNQPSSRLFGLSSAPPATQQQQQQTEYYLRSLLFDNLPGSDAPNQSDLQRQQQQQQMRSTTISASVGPPPPPGLTAQQTLYGNAAAAQRLPPGFSPDNLMRQGYDLPANPIDDFLGRGTWSKLDQSRNSLFPLDQQQQQQQQQVQNQQSYSKMLGLMNLRPGKEEVEATPSPFPAQSPFNSSFNPASSSKVNGGFGDADSASFGRGFNSYGSQHRASATGSGSGLMHSGSPSNNSSVKDWQEGFRALLPNVNISFGQGTSLDSMANSNGGSGFSNTLPPWDDPAIVTAANSKQFNKNNNNNNNYPLRSGPEVRGGQDDQPHWMKSLQQLTELSEPTQQAPIPQGNASSAFLPTLAGVNHSSLINGPLFNQNLPQQAQQHPPSQQLCGGMPNNRLPSDRRFPVGVNPGDWPPQFPGSFAAPPMTSAPPGFRFPDPSSSQTTATGASN